jgi:hypothetical protein
MIRRVFKHEIKKEVEKFGILHNEELRNSYRLPNVGK